MTLELTTTALFLISTLYGTVAPVDSTLEKSPSSQPEIRPTADVLADQPLTLEAYVREYFKDTPIMAEIAKCESRFRHIGRDGNVIRGDVVREDVGVMQINEYFHEDTARVLGLDLHTLDGNLAYAKWLYNRDGVTPWFSSSKCWQKSDTLAKADITVSSN